jgi:hypothetical protein
MKTRNQIKRHSGLVIAALTLMSGAAAAYAQPPLPPPPELDRLVQRIALYPDSLLSQVLAASTYSNQIPEAARWADQHHYLTGDALAAAINADQLPWDPSVQALLPFPSVLDMMASDINWTSRLGDAFLVSQADVMDAVQRMRHAAYDYGYLRSNEQIVVRPGPYIEIGLVNPGYVIVPYYDPLIVFARPRPGFFVGGAIRFGFGINIGVAFRPWGWGYSRFDWGHHGVFVNDHPWQRTFVNRETYAHPYEVRRFAPEARRPAEAHELHERSEHEREASRSGRPRVEEHHDEHRR